MLRRFAASNPEVRLIGLTYENIAPVALRQFVVAHDPGDPVAHIDPNGIPRALKPTWFGLHALPLTDVVSSEGTVAKRMVGELCATQLQKMVTQLTTQ